MGLHGGPCRDGNQALFSGLNRSAQRTLPVFVGYCRGPCGNQWGGPSGRSACAYRNGWARVGANGPGGAAWCRWMGSGGMSRAPERTQRNPMLSFEFPGVFLFRLAERRFLGSLSKEPPRSTRRRLGPRWLDYGGFGLSGQIGPHSGPYGGGGGPHGGLDGVRTGVV